MNIFGYDLQESVVLIIRIIATIGSAVVGWFVCDPLTRAAYRLSFRAATPGALLFCGKAIGGAALAAAVWFLMPDGSGGGGPGFGPGKGGLPGKGADKGGEKPGDPAKDAKTDAKKEKTEASDRSAQKLEPVEIEIISAGLYEKLKAEGKEHWYVIKQKTYSLDELDDYLKANRDKIEVTPVLTNQSIQFGRDELAQTTPTPMPEKPTPRTKKYNIKTLQWVAR
jgi:hypothetical protein